MGEETWKVVGGSKGGIVVREGKVLSSPELPERLSKGSLLRELELHGERLHFERVTGSGPASGWVSTKVGGKDIVVKGGCVPLDKVNFGRPIIKSTKAAGSEVWLLCDHHRNTAQSHAALALGLMKGNYRVRFFGPPASEALVRSLGIPFTSAGLTLEDWQKIMIDTGQVDRIWDMGSWGKDNLRSIAEVLNAALKAAPKQPDIICHTTTSYPVALGLFSKFGVAVVLANASLPLEGWDPGLHALLVSLSDVVEEVLDVSPFRGIGWDGFYGLLLSPRQIMGTSAVDLEFLEAGGEVQREFATKIMNNLTGYWYLPADVQIKVEQPNAFGGPETLRELEAFLQKGPAVYIGWGMKVFGDYSGHLTVVAVAALKSLGMRGIIAAGVEGGPSPDALAAAVFPADSQGLVAYAQANVLFLPHCAPHEWLFPKCACVVHHGGSGTTAAALRGSAPMVITPAEERNWRYGVFAEKQGLGANVASGLWDCTAEDLAKAIKQALQSSVKAKAQEFAAKLSQEFGVRNACLGMTMYLDSEVKSGKLKEEWKRMKVQEEKEKAFHKELAEEPEDGVLRPPPNLLASGPAVAAPPPGGGRQPPRRFGTAQASVAPPPPWLRPDGKGKIMTLCTPLKGHVIHFKRIVQWFRDRAPGWEVHMVLCCDEPDIPAGVIKHVADPRPEAGKNFTAFNSIFAMAAGLETGEKVSEEFAEKKEGAEDGDGFDLLGEKLPKLFMETFWRIRPNVVITECSFMGLPMEGFMPALCRTYEVLLVSIIPMCIKENKGHSMARVWKTLERRQKHILEQAYELHWVLESQEEGSPGGEHKEGEGGAEGEATEWQPEGALQQTEAGEEGKAKEEAKEEAKEGTAAPKEEKAPEAAAKKEERRKEGDQERPSWMPDKMTMEELNHIIWKVMPATQFHPNLELLPSPGFFHAEKPEAWEVYCAPFVSLPSLSASGAPQHGREVLEGAIEPELLDWLFSAESDDPIVYMAFGTIVSHFNSRVLVERLVEALSDAPWRVLMVLPEDARAGLPKEGDSNFWRWTALGAEVSKSLAKVREGDIFTEEHLELLRKTWSKFRDHATLAELGIITESKARAELLTPSRFRVESFVPQVHVLRCERVRCFISHMGANSTLESMACGVPMLCTPFFMDQYDWAHTVRQNLRAGIQVDKILTGAESLRGAVQELLEVPAYRKNAQAVARRIAAQSEMVSKALGPALTPKASLGPGLSVLGAMCVGHIKKQDVWPTLEGPLYTPPRVLAAGS